MQKRMASVKTGGNTITLLAPTGSGKTVAFAIALLKSLGPATDGYVPWSWLHRANLYSRSSM